VRRTLPAALAVALAISLGGAAHGFEMRGSEAAPIPFPCGLPQAQPVWIDYADGMVPFWSTIFARPGIVGAASQFIVPPQLRAHGAQTVYFDLYLGNRVGTPSKPADPSVVQARADKLFQTAVTSSGCAQPVIAENELAGANLPTPWTATTAQYRANVLAYLQRLSVLGARPFLLLPKRPYTHDETADDWWRSVAQVADLVPEVYFAAPAISRQGAVLGSRHLRATMRSRLEDLIEIGIPTSRLGMMLTFSSTRGAGGREGLQPLSRWLDVTKWEALAAGQVSSELRIASIWSWGWAAFNPAGNDPDKPKVACTWLWTRDPSLCDAPALAGDDLDPSRNVGATLPAGTVCVLGQARVRALDVAAAARVVGDPDLAFSAAFQHAVLVNARAVDPARTAQAERDVILDRFRGSRSAYLAALARARATPAFARAVLADELRRVAVSSGLRVAKPTATELRNWYATYGAARARPVRTAAPVEWLGRRRVGIALDGVAPARLFSLAAGQTVTIDGVRVTALAETLPLGGVPYAAAAPAIRVALVRELERAGFAVWLRRRENQSRTSLACAHDRVPETAVVDLTDWLPFLALP
jgi:hypothetical protein